MSRTGSFLTFGILTALLIPSGCSFSASSTSISKSISSPSKSSGSSSKSSSPGDQYRDDVRDFTAAHLQSGGDVGGLSREIGKIAEKRGVTDWENDESTYRGIGAGLAKAGRGQIEVEAFKTNLSSNEEQAKWIQKGYDEAK
jgi:hypothetical protein